MFARQALDIQTQARHWKSPPILVGGVALVWGPNGPRRVYGHNYKPHPGTLGPRLCMEEMIEGWALLKQCDTIVGIATAASYQWDDVYKKDMQRTLPLCPNCRQRIYPMLKSGDLYLPETRFFAQRVDTPHNVTEVAEYSLKEHIREFPPEEGRLVYKKQKMAGRR